VDYETKVNHTELVSDGSSFLFFTFACSCAVFHKTTTGKKTSVIYSIHKSEPHR